ncbi:MAG: TatD family hydrolase [Kiritimatiellia bacterium]
MYTDTHFHLDHFALNETIPHLMSDAEAADVTRLIAIGGSDEANALALTTAHDYPDRLWCSVGYDRDLSSGWDGDLSRLRPLLTDPKVVAIGECGIDYFHDTDNAVDQKRLFSAMLDLAVEVQKPVVVHSREADADTLDLLRDFSRRWPDPDRACAVLHCFTGSLDFARKLIDLNLMISFSGILSFKNAADLREVASVLPEDRLLIETDSPYLAPEPHRGQRNQPAYVAEVARVLAEARNLPLDDLSHITTRNARHLFQLP